MKSVKVKVLSGVLAVGLVSSVGVAFASTDAGANLKTWYDGQFGKAQTSVATQSALYVGTQVPGLQKEYNNLKKDATKAISETQISETSGAQTEVTVAKNAHISSLKAKQTEIEGYIQSQFDGITQDAHSAIGKAGVEVQNYAYADLLKQTNSNGQTSLKKLNEELKASNEAALKELEKAISDAKQELQANLNEKTSSSVQKIKEAVDAKIWELRGKITVEKDRLVGIQKGLIADEAQRLEDLAKADLDAAVVGINK